MCLKLLCLKLCFDQWVLARMLGIFATRKSVLNVGAPVKPAESSE